MSITAVAVVVVFMYVARRKGWDGCFFFFFGMLCLLLVSCHRLKEGKVIERHFIEAHTYTWLQVVPVGTKGATATIIHTGYMPDEYKIFVRGFDGKDTITESWYVDPVTAECLPVGSWFVDSLPCRKE